MCDYPDDKEFSEILELIEKNDHSVMVWEPFEYYEGSQE